MRKSKPILVSGFEPFGGDAINPSALVAQALHGRTVGGAGVVGVVLPCAFGTSIAVLREALRRHRPQLVLALGLAAGRGGFSLERVAVNLDDARIPDNAGAQPIDMPVVERGPTAHFTTLPIKAMAAALREAGHAAEISNSAGTFVCNHVFYAMQHLLCRRKVRSGFMHLPLLPEQAHGQPAITLQDMIDGTALALRAALTTAGEDLRAEGGALS
jgi:pyroglutamyl-peptidase